MTSTFTPKSWIRVYWVDDAIDTNSHAWGAQRMEPTLFLGIRADRGLTEDDVKLLIEFAESVRPS